MEHSAFGVDDSRIEKTATAKVAVSLRKLPKVAEKVGEAAKATGPGSMRSRMSMRAWESQTAATRRSQP